MDITPRQIRMATEALPAVAPIARTYLNDKMQMRALERQKEAEMEVVRAKNEYRQQASFPITSTDPQQQVVEQTDDAFEQSIDDMISDEDCELCSRLLEGIKSVDPDHRAVALSEFGRFKQSVDDTEDADAIRSEIEGMTVLKDVMTREFNMVPSE